MLTRPRTIQGFSLIELLVASSVFTLALVLGSGALVQAQGLARTLRANQYAFDGIGMVAEYVGRDIRYGTEFHCGPYTDSDVLTRKNCTFTLGADPVSAIVFRSQEQDGLHRVAYWVDGGSLYRGELINGLPPTDPKRITSDDVLITKAGFYVQGALSSSDGEYMQPAVTIMISGRTRSREVGVTSVPFTYYSTIAVRGIDN